MSRPSFICDRCGDKNDLSSVSVGEIIGCKNCGNQKIVESKSGTFTSYTDLKEDDNGKYFISNPMSSPTVSECDKCESEIEHGDKIYGTGFDSGYSHTADETVCQNCRKKQEIVDGLEENDSGGVTDDLFN